MFESMPEIESLQKDIALSRRELKNIRQEVIKLKAKQKKESEDIKLLLSKQYFKEEKNLIVKEKNENENSFNMVPIGFISSCFKNKNGIPRQPSLCQTSKASLEINKTFFTNPEHSLIGLSEFSFVWILFVFHKNKEGSVKAKVHPPRMNGMSVGVFSTRSPHRPCAIGLSLTKIEKITGNTIFLSGVDILDGTPVLDIKPYIPSYDVPKLYRNLESLPDGKDIPLKDTEDSFTPHSSSTESINDDDTSMKLKFKDKIYDTHEDIDSKRSEEDKFQTDASTFSIGTMLSMPANHLEVLFTERATKDIEKFHSLNHDNKCEYCLTFMSGHREAKQAIAEILQNDPRSVYRKNKCSDKLYFFEIDTLHVTCWFDEIIAEVLRVKPINKGSTA